MHYLNRKVIYWLISFLTCLSISSLYAKGLEAWHPRGGKHGKIFFSGTLLAISAQNTPPGHLNYENFFQYSKIYGIYDQHSRLRRDRDIDIYSVLPLIKFGIFDFLDFNIITSVNYSRTKHGDDSSFGDTIALFGLKLLDAKAKTWIPDMKLLFGGSLPTGKFDTLDPELFGGDATGSGSIIANLVLSLAKVFPINENHALRFNPNLFFFIPSPVDISGVSIFGGTPETRGKVKPKNQYGFDFPIEYNLTHHWIIGTDIFYLYRGSASFHSRTLESAFEIRSSDNLSLAPCLEYSPSEKLGIEAGVWFSVTGRNSEAFATTIIFTWFYF